MLAELANIPDLQKYIDDMGDPLETDAPPEEISSPLLVEQDSMLISGPKPDIDGIKALLRTIRGQMEKHERVHRILQNVDGFDWTNDENLLFIVLAVAAHLTNSANKIVVPCVSLDQKLMMLEKLDRLIEHENLEGPFALGRALEFMIADFEPLETVPRRESI